MLVIARKSLQPKRPARKYAGDRADPQVGRAALEKDRRPPKTNERVCWTEARR